MSTVTDVRSAEEAVGDRWTGTILDAGASREVVLETTGDCVTYRSATGRSGTVPSDHVSVVESEVRTSVEYRLQDHRVVVGAGAGLAALAFAGAVLATSALLTLGLVVLTSGGLWTAERGWRNRDEYDGFERRTSEVERVVLYTDAGRRLEFRFPVEDDAGADLRRFVHGT